jgi:hypothetical protein
VFPTHRGALTKFGKVVAKKDAYSPNSPQLAILLSMSKDSYGARMPIKSWLYGFPSGRGVGRPVVVIGLPFPFDFRLHGWLFHHSVRVLSFPSY